MSTYIPKFVYKLLLTFFGCIMIKVSSVSHIDEVIESIYITFLSYAIYIYTSWIDFNMKYIWPEFISVELLLSIQIHRKFNYSCKFCSQVLKRYESRRTMYFRYVNFIFHISTIKKSKLFQQKARNTTMMYIQPVSWPILITYIYILRRMIWLGRW